MENNFNWIYEEFVFLLDSIIYHSFLSVHTAIFLKKKQLKIPFLSSSINFLNQISCENWFEQLSFFVDVVCFQEILSISFSFEFELIN